MASNQLLFISNTSNKRLDIVFKKRLFKKNSIQSFFFILFYFFPFPFIQFLFHSGGFGVWEVLRRSGKKGCGRGAEAGMRCMLAEAFV